MLELPERRSIRAFRLEAHYTACRLKALEETRDLAGDFDEATDKLARLEQEDAAFALRRMETQAAVETADDEWDDTMVAFRNRLLEAAGHSTDAELYRRYFADIPSHVTSLSYAAEILISKELETSLRHEALAELSSFADRLQNKRFALEKIIEERTRLEVEEARFANRVELAKQILNHLRRVLAASLQEVAKTHHRDDEWVARFFYRHNATLAESDQDGVEATPPPPEQTADGDEVAESD